MSYTGHWLQGKSYLFSDMQPETTEQDLETIMLDFEQIFDRHFFITFFVFFVVAKPKDS